MNVVIKKDKRQEGIYGDIRKERCLIEKINFNNNQQPALNSTNLNKLQDNIEDSIKSQKTTSDTDTYSCNYINNINIYSANETLTGETWINGKPIYRKVLNIGTADFYSSTDNHFTHGIDDLDTMLNVTYSMYFSGDNCYYNQWDKIITIKSSSTRVSFTTGSISGTYIRFTNVKIILKYTKTTD